MNNLIQTRSHRLEDVPRRSDVVWFVAHVRPRCEKKMARYCDEINVKTLVPLYRSVHKYGNKRAFFDKPLFPGYVFLHASPFDRRNIYRSDYVANILAVHDQELLEQQLSDILRA